MDHTCLCSSKYLFFLFHTINQTNNPNNIISLELRSDSTNNTISVQSQLLHHHCKTVPSTTDPFCDLLFWEGYMNMHQEKPNQGWVLVLVITSMVGISLSIAENMWVNKTKLQKTCDLLPLDCSGQNKPNCLTIREFTMATLWQQSNFASDEEFCPEKLRNQRICRCIRQCKWGMGENWRFSSSGNFLLVAYEMTICLNSSDMASGSPTICLNSSALASPAVLPLPNTLRAGGVLNLFDLCSCVFFFLFVFPLFFG